MNQGAQINEQQPEALRLADRIDLKDYYEFDASLHCQKAAAELRRLHSVEKAFQQWITKTEWVQKSSQSHELGMHRADVMKQRLDQLLTENQQLRAALEQPKNHVPDAGNMVTAGWKLVPIEPTDDMLYDIQEFSHILPPRGKRIWAHMLAAAPQPPTVKECLTVEQPQANQPAMTPIAQRKLEDLVASGYTISGYSIYHERKHQHGFVTGAGLVGWWKPEGMEYPQPQVEQEPVAWMVTSEMQDGTRSTYPMIGRFKDVQDCCDFGEPVPLIYQHPQPKREPLTDERIDAIADAMPGGLEGFMKGWGWRQFARAVLEVTHNIK